MRASRLLGITLILIDKETISAAELARTFEVSPRTIYRDIEALTMAGVPVYSTPGVGGGISIMPGYKLERGTFTEGEVMALTSAVSGLEGLVDPETLAAIRAKLASLSANPATTRGERELVIDGSAWIKTDEPQKYLPDIRAAIHDNAVLLINYIDGMGEQTTRQIEPHQLMQKGGSEYLVAWCQMRDDFRTFKLSRITHLERTTEKFTRKELPEARLDATPFWKQIEIEILIRIEKSVADRVLDQCSFDRFREDGPDHYLVRYPFADKDYYYEMLMSLGDKCEVLEPECVRAKMRQKAQALLDLYRR